MGLKFEGPEVIGINKLIEAGLTFINIRFCLFFFVVFARLLDDATFGFISYSFLSRLLLRLGWAQDT